MNYFFKFIQIGAIALCAFHANSSFAGSLELEVKDREKNTGTIKLALYYSESAFSETEKNWDDLVPLIESELALEEGVANNTFVDLAGGWYAVRLFLDVNQNGELDRSPRGMPLEPVGFSSNPNLFGGEPRIQDVSFCLDENQQLTIKLIKNRRAKKLK